MGTPHNKNVKWQSECGKYLHIRVSSKQQSVEDPVTTIDIEDKDLIGNRSWYLSGSGRKYVVAGISRWCEKKEKRIYSNIYLHRLIIGAEEGDITDHINGDTLDNRRENLRLVTQQQNCWNKSGYTRKKSKSNSKYKGVSFHARTGKWYARVTMNGKPYHLGGWPTEEEAARKVDEFTKIHHGEYARLNFPDE